MKTVLVTGATEGIGRETARQLLAQGDRVLLHGRTPEKAERAVTDLLRSIPAGCAEPVHGDLSAMDQVLALSEQVRARAEALDVLINNAGVYEKERRLTRDGLELTMAVNHFAPFLLTRELLDRVQAAPGGRIITVSSSAHANGKIEPDDPSFATDLEGYRAYAASKLANVLFTAALANRLAGSPTTANSLDPGVITTKLLYNGWGTTGDPVEQGARTSVYLATAAEVRDVNGAYFVDCRRVDPSAAAQDPQLAEALWRTTEALLRPFAGAGARSPGRNPRHP